MPRYVYSCEKCNSYFQVWHGMKEVQEKCETCHESGHLVKVPQKAFVPKAPIQDNKTGKITEEYINENANILKEMKEEARKNIYED